MLLTLAVSGYRSLREVVVPLGRLNVVTGPNGSGKSSLYRSIRLLASVSRGEIIGALAAEGGLSSAIWAGPERLSASMKRGDVPVQGTRRNRPVSVRLGFASEDFGYAIDLGLPSSTSGRSRVEASRFSRDPEIKSEAVWAGEILRPANTLVSRSGSAITALTDQGNRRVIETDLAPYDSMMMRAASPDLTPEVLELRERMRSWRFYDQMRTDSAAPCRRPQIGTRTFALADDGADLAAALQTIFEIGDADGLDAAIDDAFPGSRIRVSEIDGYFEVALEQAGMLRPLRASELSDGTLRYLLLAAALLTPRPPSLMVLNEPETSLHGDLIPALARLIVRASETSQVIVVTHAADLAEALCAEGARRFLLSKELGETRIDGADAASFAWPKR